MSHDFENLRDEVGRHDRVDRLENILELGRADGRSQPLHFALDVGRHTGSANA